EPVDRRGLRLRQRARAAVGLGGAGVARALLVLVPAAGVVAVRVDAVLVVAVDAVAVVVAQRLAPQAVRARLARAAQVVGRTGAAGEGEVVAVGVLDRDEPDLRLLEQRGDVGVVRVIAETLHLAARRV